MANDIETISYINPGDGLDHPIDAVTVNGLTLTSAEKELWNNKQDALSFDSIPTENSNNLVKSGPLYSVITENELITATALNDLNDRVTSLEDFSETDPTVPEWAKASTKPTYTASEVGALPDTTVIPTEATVTGWGFTKNTGTLTGVTFNGISASVSNGIASISASKDVEIVDLTSTTPDSSTGDYIFPNGTYQTLSNYISAGKLVIIKVKLAWTQGSDATYNLYYNYGGGDYSIICFTGFDEINKYYLVTINSGDEGYSEVRVNEPESDPVFSASPAAGISAADISNWNAKQNALVFDSIPTENSDNLVKSGVLYSVITDNELVVSTALNDLNDRVSDLENNTGSGGITSVMFNGMSASISDGVASISVSIPAEVTEATVAGWGFTKNTGTISSIVFNGTSASVSNGVASITAVIPEEKLVCLAYNVNNSNNPTQSELNGAYTAANTAITAGKMPYLKLTDAYGTSIYYYDDHYTSDGLNYIVFERFDGTFETTIGLVSNGTIIRDDFSISADWLEEDSNKPSYIFNKPTIPAEVTEETVSSWGFTKNSGTLTSHATHKLNIGSATATAAASNTITYVESLTGTTTATSGNLTITPTLKTITVPAEVTESTVVGWGFTKNTGTLTSETDPVFSASVAASISAADISNWNSKTSNTGTITGISMNGSSMGTSGNVNLGSVVTGLSMNGSAVTVSNGVADLGTVLTSHQSIKTINGQTITGTGDVTISGLPTATSSDNGKILQVVNGSWTLVTPVSIYSGNGSPDNTQGTNGDLYIQTS